MSSYGTSPQSAGERRCWTRAYKNARYLKIADPESYPADLLARLHELTPDSPELAAHPSLARALGAGGAAPSPPAGKVTLDPLFNGAIHFARVTFQTPAGNFAITAADLNTIVQFMQHAAVPIGQYAAQYGPNSLTVSPNVIAYSAPLPGTTFTDANVQHWVNDIAAKNHLPASAAVAIVTPDGVTSDQTDHQVGDGKGYHGKANIPYAIFGVFAQGLKPQDLDDNYSMIVSHECAELVVDPKANFHNPEACDPCDLNCGEDLHRAYFDANNAYLGTLPDLPPPFPFSYYICAIVKPAAANACPASAPNCDYAPPGGKLAANVKPAAKPVA